MTAAELETLQRRVQRKLENLEVQAIAWAQQNYGAGWRRRFRETLARHMTRQPERATEPLWADCYYRPFGDDTWNAYVQIMYRLVQEEGL
jgi:hypothetical protein